MLVVFLLIAQRKGTNAAEIGRATGLSQSSVSRNVQGLGRGKGDEPGLGLVTQIIDPANPRAHRIHLTAKGAALAKELAGAMRGNVAAGEPAPPPPSQHLDWRNWMD